jgi:hydroxyethylthiazole kinase
MKQLTGRENYSKYWVYRGWLDARSFHAPWWNPSRPNRAPAIPDPQRLSTNEFAAIDAGGWYWDAGAASNQFRSINSIIATQAVDRQSVRAVARAINGINRQTGDPNGLTERLAETQDVALVLLDGV